MVKKVYEADPLLCPRYGGAMRIIACIDQSEVIGNFSHTWGCGRIPVFAKVAPAAMPLMPRHPVRWPSELCPPEAVFKLVTKPVGIVDTNTPVFPQRYSDRPQENAT